MSNSLNAKIAQEERKLKPRLKDFSPKVSKEQLDRYKASYTYRFEDLSFDKCRLIPYVLDNLIGCKVYWFPFEKIFWQSDFSYKTAYCTIAHKKFGFYLYISKDLTQEQADKIAAELKGHITFVVDNLDTIVDLYAKDALRNGRIIVNNKYEALEDRYILYRDLARQEVVDEFTIEGLRSQKNTEEAWKYFSKHRRIRNSQHFHEETALVYFISLVEHICILLYAFYHDGGSVIDLANKDWARKFEQVIGLDDPKIKAGFEYLKSASLYRRNPIAHGYLTRKMTEASFFFAPVKQRTPINLFNDEMLHNSATKLDLKKLDQLLDDIKASKKFHNAMRCISKDWLDISFDQKSLAEYSEVNLFNEQELEEYIDARSWDHDNAANMDW